MIPWICSLDFVVDPVVAYLDPGTGTVILQVIIAGMLSMGALFKYYWHSIIGFFRSKPSDTEADGSNSAESHADSDEEHIDKKAA